MFQDKCCRQSCCGNMMAQPMMGQPMMNQPMMGQPMMAQPMMEGQVVEPTITKCVEQEFFHEVPHVCPIHTHTVNKHIYKHTYTPQFSCSEESQVVNMDCGKCSGFLG